MEGKIQKFVAVASVVVGLALFSGGCAKKVVKSDADMAPEPPPVQAPDTGRTRAEPMQDESLMTPPKMDTMKVLEGRTTAPMLPVYYDFDKSNIRDDQKGRIEQDAHYLKQNPKVSIRIEGNCDERGTNEYNIALGERRAMSAKKYMVNLGIAADRLETLSYGEERPLLHGHDELSWAQNRRADFVVVR